MSTAAVTVGIVVLAVGSFALRAGGVLLRHRLPLGDEAERLVERGTVVLLVAVSLVSALTDGAGAAPVSRVAGVAVGAAAALLKAPLVVVVIVAAGTAAGLRALGV